MYKFTQSIGLFVGTIFFVLYQIQKNDDKQKNMEKEKEEEKSVRKERDKRKLNPLWNEPVLFGSLFTSHSEKVNSNIHPDLFRYETFENMNRESNEEHVWKQRILMQNTPHGNISMFYDLYRQSFAYYADNHLSYTVLNQCAMKYVRIFFCRDFFVDTTVLPDSFVNPFNKMKEEEELRLKLKSANKRKDLKINFDSSTFVKKNKKVVIVDLAVKEKKIKEEMQLVYKNNFRCAGKLSGDWKLLKQNSPTKKNRQEKEISDDYDHIRLHGNPETVKSSYNLWKSIATTLAN